MKKTSVLLNVILIFALGASPACAVITYQTGFNQTNDVSGSQYIIGQINGQNGWFRTVANPTYEQSDIRNDTISHDGDGYLRVACYNGIGIAHVSGITTGSGVANGAVKITMDIASGIGGNPYTAEIRSSQFGMLLRLNKYQGADVALSNAQDKGGNTFAGGSTPVNNARWPNLSDGHIDANGMKFTTKLELIITSHDIRYRTTDYWSENGLTYSNEVLHTYTLSTPITDLRNFGDIQFIGTSASSYVPLYVDNLKIEYLPVPSEGTVLLYQTGFNLTNDASGTNYTANGIDGQNGWKPKIADPNNNERSTVSNDSAIGKWGDGVFRFECYADQGTVRDASAFQPLPPVDSNSAVKISMDIAADYAEQNPVLVKIRSSKFGTLLRWDKDNDEGSQAYCCVRDAGGDMDVKTSFTSSIWAGWNVPAGYAVNYSRWPQLSLGRSKLFFTNLEMTITSTKIVYHSVNYWTDEQPYVKEVTHEYVFSSPLSDVRNFGNIEFVGASNGSYVPMFIDNLKIAYYISPACGDNATVYLPGDINKDCYINFGDVGEFCSEWLRCTDPENSNCGQ